MFLKFSLFRYQGQTQFYKWKQSDFQMALEEAVLAENGFLDTCHKTCQIGYPDAQPSGSSHDLDYLYSQNQASLFRTIFLVFMTLSFMKLLVL